MNPPQTFTNQAQRQPVTGNRAISKEQKLAKVLAELNANQPLFASLLPNDIPFAKFSATINQALRNEPDLLECEFHTVMNAAIDAAYDGLNVDGREATMYVRKVKVAKNPDRWEKHACYTSMVFGLRKKILQSGQVLDLVTRIVYANEPFRIVAGSDPRIDHEIIADGSKRGEKIGVYSMAFLANGRSTFEYMTEEEVLAVRACATTDYVWNKNEGEMWRKTVTRRHRKSLPSTRDLPPIDAEMLRESVPLPSDSREYLAPPPPRPTLGAAQRQIGFDALGQFSGVPLDFRNMAPVNQAKVDVSGNDPQILERRTATRTAQPTDGQSPANHTSQQPLPDDQPDLEISEKDIRTRIAAAGSIEACTTLWQHCRKAMEGLPDAIRDELDLLFSDRIADLAAGAGGPA
jgi:recombination protein RecT